MQTLFTTTAYDSVKEKERKNEKKKDRNRSFFRFQTFSLSPSHRFPSFQTLPLPYESRGVSHTSTRCVGDQQSEELVVETHELPENRATEIVRLVQRVRDRDCSSVRGFWVFCRGLDFMSV